MSVSHPIIAVTGSSGAGTTTVRRAFEKIFQRLDLAAAYVDGDSFHRYTRGEITALLAEPDTEKSAFNHFGLRGNLLERLEALFAEYAARGTGSVRRYVHDEDVADIAQGYPSGTFTPWDPLPPGTDLLLYEGLHGGFRNREIDVARHVDLLVGVVPIINLEWLQKINRDTRERGYSEEAVVDTILGRMGDYVRHIVPQFSRTHVNFQRVPTVDTSNPFIFRDVPSDAESFVVISFRDPAQADFPSLLRIIHNAFKSRDDTIVIPGTAFGEALELVMGPLIENIARVRTR